MLFFFNCREFSLMKASIVVAKSTFLDVFDISIWLIKDYISLMNGNRNLVDLYRYLSFTHAENDIVLDVKDIPVESKESLNIFSTAQEVVIEANLVF